MTECLIEPCDDTARHIGLCAMHYSRKRRGSAMDAPRRTARAVDDFACPDCARELESDDFYWHNGYRDRVCKRCRILAKAVREYGCSEEDFLRIMDPSLPCTACGTLEGKMVLDHNHVTGEPRAKLCNNCNVAAGMLSDDPSRARALATYLEVYGG